MVQPSWSVIEGQAFCFQLKETQAFKLSFMKHPAVDRAVSRGEQERGGGQPSLGVLMSEGRAAASSEVCALQRLATRLPLLQALLLRLFCVLDLALQMFPLG